MTERPSIIWYDNFWDYPISGLAEFKGERFYFDLKDSNDPIDKYSLPKDVLEKIHRIEMKFMKKMDELFGDEDTEDIGSVDNYVINRYDSFIVRPKVSYTLYRVPPDIMKCYLKNYKKWRESRNESVELDEDTIKSLENYEGRRITREDIPSFESIGVFLYEGFEKK